MDTVFATEAGSRLYGLIDETAAAHKPVLIKGQRNNAVLISEEDWNAIQETLYLLSVPGLRESIHEGMNTPIEECDQELGW
jgi:prevent-host-death family protein